MFAAPAACPPTSEADLAALYDVWTQAYANHDLHKVLGIYDGAVTVTRPDGTLATRHDLQSAYEADFTDAKSLRWTIQLDRMQIQVRRAELDMRWSQKRAGHVVRALRIHDVLVRAADCAWRVVRRQESLQAD